MNYLAFDDKLFPNGRGQGHVIGFFKICPIISLESVKLQISYSD